MVDIKKLGSNGSSGLADALDAADAGSNSTLPFEQMGMSFSHGAPCTAAVQPTRKFLW